ncbi:hypothetical protein FCJ60_32255 [Burkholderia metallica]|nr:hypothetical protein [Burkholderia metallica]
MPNQHNDTFSRWHRRALAASIGASIGFLGLGWIAAAGAAQSDGPAAASAGVAGSPAPLDGGGRHVLYVTRVDHADRRVDDDVRRYLEAHRFDVEMVDESAPVSRSRGKDLVVISSVVSARNMTGTGYRDVPVPLVTWENDLFDSLRMTGQKKGVDYGEVGKEHYVTVVNAAHPLAGGLPAGKRWVYPRDEPMGWGVPAPGAYVAVTLAGEPRKAVVFGYEKGATMDYDFVAPARRVAFFLDNTTFGKLSADGRALFDAAVGWAVAR